jgi:zinc D-Ala-D-Ala carboxypeptidase
MTKLTAHFSLEELIRSSTAERLGIDNAPSAEVFQHLQQLAEKLEEVREALGAPIHVDSGYRCLKLNAVVRGAVSSAHLRGWAADFVCPAFGTPAQIVKRLLASPLRFDQLIQEGTWVHMSFEPRMRQQVLMAHFTSAGVQYTKGA